MTGNVYEFDGGTPPEREELKAFYEQVWRANDTLEDDALRPVWSDAPDRVFFNTNGHAYYGVEDWFRIWAHYRPRLKASAGGSSERIRVIVRGDMAVFIDDRRGRVLRWVDQKESQPEYITSYMRSTVVCLRVDGVWEGVHAHYSSGKTGPRPDQQT